VRGSPKIVGCSYTYDKNTGKNPKYGRSHGEVKYLRGGNSHNNPSRAQFVHGSGRFVTASQRTFRPRQKRQALEERAFLDLAAFDLGQAENAVQVSVPSRPLVFRLELE
jgi:hypothetical protein